MYVQIGRYHDDDTPREEHVVIHQYDTWNMDHTLALIILPMLKQLKETTHGAPAVEFKDVPEELHPANAEEASKLYWQNGETDENYFKRWEYVLDEMIYAFDCKANQDEAYIRFNDLEEAKREQERISNGFRLFGKYYENLWD